MNIDLYKELVKSLDAEAVGLLTKQFLYKLDPNLLLEQKQEVIEMLSGAAHPPPHVEDALNGIVHFLDAFQDMMADDFAIWKFPEDTEASGTT